MNEADATHDPQTLKMGLLDVVRLAHAFATQKEELHRAREKNQALEKELDGLRERQDRQRELVELGEQEVERLRRETESRLRAITLHTRDEDRLARLRARLGAKDVSPRQLQRWHETISEEFRLMYPTRRIAEPSSRLECAGRDMESLARYRFRSEPVHKKGT